MKLRTLLCCVLVAACGGKKDDAPAPAAKPADPSAAVTPTKPTYSPAAVKEQLAAMAKCDTSAVCEPMDTLVGFGANAGPDLVAFLGDASKPIEQRRIAAVAIGKIKVAGAGPKLVELGNAASDVTAQEDFYTAAGLCGGDATFDALAALYDKQNHGDTDDHLVMLRRGLAAFPDKALAWAKAKLPGAEDKVKYADILLDLAKDKDDVAALAFATEARDRMASNRLASKAIQLGSTDQKVWDLLIQNLGSDDHFDQADAADFINEVVDKLPAARKAKVLDLTKKALTGPPDPMVNDGLEKLKKTLGG
jgi:hypothetical protein